MARARHLHAELPELRDVIIDGRQGRGRPLLALLDEVPQTDAVHELKKKKNTPFTNVHRGDELQL